MVIKFVKDHLRHKAGEVADIVDAQAEYFIRCNVAIQVKAEQPKVQQPVQTPKKKRTTKKK